jgi:hypothetical protein
MDAVLNPGMHEGRRDGGVSDHCLRMNRLNIDVKVRNCIMK